MNKILKRILIGVGLLAVVGLMAWPKLPKGEPAAEDAPQPGDTRLSVSVVVVEPQRLRDRINATGSILANEEVELRSEASGKILKLHFQEGRPISQGDLLLKINDNELQAQARQAQHRLHLAEDREQRQRQLLERGNVSQQEYDAILNEVNVQRAAADLIQAQIDKTELRAPFDGLIGLRYVSEGSYITPTTQIATLQDISQVKIEFSIPERHADRVKVGDAIFFSVEGREGTYRGQIYAFEPRIEAGTRTLRLRARSPNTNARLLPGAFARVELVFEEIEGAVAIPALAIIPELGGKKVYVYSQGQAVPRPVETGLRLEDRVQIVSGLSPQDTVITSGIQQLRPGLPVRLAGVDASLSGGD